MSGTGQKYAATDVSVVLAAHGDRGGETPNATLLDHASNLASRNVFRHVAAGTLRSQELTLDNALRAARNSGASMIAVYPIFMADGYFTAKVLPDAIAAAGMTELCTVLPPLGLDPQLPDIMLEHALDAALGFALDPLQTRLLVAAHGSKLGQASFRSTERIAARLRARQRFALVETAYLEQSPFLSQQLTNSGLSTLVSGFFSGDGMHAGEDVPGAIAARGAGAHYAGSIGCHPCIAQIIDDAVRAAVASQRDP